MNNNKIVNLHNQESLYVRYKRLHPLSINHTFQEYISIVNNKALDALEQFDKEERNKISELELHEDKNIKNSVVALLLGYSKEIDEETSFVVFIDEINGKSTIYKVKLFKTIRNCSFKEFVTESSNIVTKEGISKYELSYFFAEQQGIIIIIE